MHCTFTVTAFARCRLSVGLAQHTRVSESSQNTCRSDAYSGGMVSMVSMVYGIWCMVYGIWHMVYGIWHMVYGIWRMVYGIWRMVYGIWCMVYGIWCVAYGAWLTNMFVYFFSPPSLKLITDPVRVRIVQECGV
jgi:hypothetical protein